MAKKEEKPPEFDRAAEAIWNAEFLLVVTGPLFEEGMRPHTSSEYCDPSTVSNPNKFMGYWGGLHNEYNERSPHEGFSILRTWRDRFFCLEDIRKRAPKKQSGEETELDRMPRFQCFTRSISGFMQKAGLPQEEIYETCGNIFLWQCSRVPPCCPKVTPIDRSFKFEIDENNNEAQPIKYMPDNREDKPRETHEVTDADEEEITLLNDEIALLSAATAATVSTTAAERKGGEERLTRRIKRMMERAVGVRLTPSLQLGHQRFPDLFQGYPKTNKECPSGPLTFSDAPEDPKALIIPSESGGEEKKEIPPHLRTPELNCQLPKRCSHLLAHVNVLDRGMYNEKIGQCYAADPEKWNTDRMNAYQQVTKVFRTDSHHIAMQRAKKITYNVSIAVTVPGSSSTADGSGYRTYVLPPSMQEKLLAVKEPDEKTKAELDATLQQWVQGKHGLFYFSNVRSRETHQEPQHHLYHDQIFIPFPLNTVDSAADGLVSPTSADGSPRTPVEGARTPMGGAADAYSGFGGGLDSTAENKPPTQIPRVHLPPQCSISVVCETVVYTAAPETSKPKPPGGASTSAGAAAVPPNPCSYTANVWQLTGRIAPPDFSDTGEFRKVQSSSSTFTSPNLVKEDSTFEYILEDRHRHVVKIGCPRNNPTAVRYIEIESPCDEEVNPTPTVFTKCSRKTNAPPEGHSESFATFLQTVRSQEQGQGPNESGKKPMPVPNHQLCVNCHDVARPFVLMTRPGVKDDGFCTSQMAQRTKGFKLWEKQMIDSLKQDQNKSVVVLELGAEKKMEPCRAYAEKTFKQLKSSKCTMVRLSPNNLETKKSGGAGGQENPNMISLVSPIIPGLQAIERTIIEKMRKKAS